MATTGSGTSTPTAGVGWSYTLEALVNRWRARLEDTREPYLWSNAELTSYADTVQKLLCAEFGLIEDRSTEGVCNVDLVAGNGLITLHPKIVRVLRCRLNSTQRLMHIEDSDHMDAYHLGWDATTVKRGVPTDLVTRGLGPGMAYVYPPLLAATDSLSLVVARMPLVDLVYEDHFNEPLEIDKFTHLLDHYIMWQAYLKQDADTDSLKRAESHRVLWEGADGRGGDKEKIQRMMMRESYDPRCASPMTAFM